MIIKTLSENTSISKDIASEHGLSLYIKTKKHKILFDVGASELFLNNAKKLDVNISDVDFLVISHGHFDHGGGLKVFLRENTNADIKNTLKSDSILILLKSTLTIAINGTTQNDRK